MPPYCEKLWRLQLFVNLKIKRVINLKDGIRTQNYWLFLWRSFYLRELFNHTIEKEANLASLKSVPLFAQLNRNRNFITFRQRLESLSLTYTFPAPVTSSPAESPLSLFITPSLSHSVLTTPTCFINPFHHRPFSSLWAQRTSWPDHFLLSIAIYGRPM